MIVEEASGPNRDDLPEAAPVSSQPEELAAHTESLNLEGNVVSAKDGQILERIVLVPAGQDVTTG